MVKTQDILSKIEWSIEQGIKVRVHFNVFSRLPIIGKFVNLEDSEELKSNNMVRFVSDSKEDNFECANDVLKANFTRVYKLESIMLVKPL